MNPILNQHLSVPIIPVPWLDQLETVRGAPTLTGSPPTPLITEAFALTTFGPLNGVTPASCSAGMNWAFDKVGIKGTGRADAVSWLQWGIDCPLQRGAVGIFRWDDGSHHVSCCDHIIDANIAAFLGFNQGHFVQMSNYYRKYLIGTRWPGK